AGRVAGDLLADAVELQDLQRVRVHEPSNGRDDPLPQGPGRSPWDTVPTSPVRFGSFSHAGRRRSQPGRWPGLIGRGTIGYSLPRQAATDEPDGRTMPLDWLTRLDPLRRIDC